MARSHDSKKIIHVVKNVSALVALPLFDISKGVVVEAMHAVFLGVVKHHTKLLVTQTNTPYYIESPDHQKLINACLLEIRPPSCRSRKPRPISTYLKWKASEWRNWLDYTPICLQGILPKKYLNHLTLLSESIHHLNSDSLTLDNLNRCKMLLKRYVRQFEEYFGEDKMTSNIHLLTHLPQTVQNWGPIWAHEAFIFEAWNRKIMYCITSPHVQANQVANRFLMHKFIITSLYDETVSLETRKLIAKLLKISIDVNRVDVRNRLIGLGKSTTRLPTEDESMALERVGYAPLNITCFKKMKVNGVKYECINDENYKFCNSAVFGDNNIIGIIKAIINFNDNDENVSGVIIQRMKVVNHTFGTEYIDEMTLSNKLYFLKELDLLKPVVKIHTARKLYVLKQTNCWETD